MSFTEYKKEEFIKLLKDVNKIKNNEPLDVNTFEELTFKTGMFGEKRSRYTFDNGLTLSVAGGDGFYGDGIVDFEIAILDSCNELMSLNIFSDEYGNVSGWQTKKDITEWIKKIKKYSTD
jgi:hypothetical protein